MNAGVKSLLEQIRQHHAFQDLLLAVESPKIRPFSPKDAAQVEHSRAQWIYESGQAKQHENWLFFLSGNTEVK
jgi:hypothetical protein